MTSFGRCDDLKVGLSLCRLGRKKEKVQNCFLIMKWVNSFQRTRSLRSIQKITRMPRQKWTLTDVSYKVDHFFKNKLVIFSNGSVPGMNKNKKL